MSLHVNGFWVSVLDSLKKSWLLSWIVPKSPLNEFLSHMLWNFYLELLIPNISLEFDEKSIQVCSGYAATERQDIFRWKEDKVPNDVIRILKEITPNIFLFYGIHPTGSQVPVELTSCAADVLPGLLRNCPPMHSCSYVSYWTFPLNKLYTWCLEY